LADDEVATVMPQEGARLEFDYLLPAPMDITFGGSTNRIEIVMTVGLPDATLEVILVETSDNWAQRDIVITGPGTYTFMLADFVGPDLTQISEVHVNLETTREGDYHIADIRLAETGTEDMGFTTVTPIITGPSPEPVQFSVRGITDDSQDKAHLLDLSVLTSESFDIPIQIIPVEIRATDSGEGTRMPGRRAAVSVESIVPTKADHREVAIDMHIGVEPEDLYPTIPNMPMLMMVASDPSAFCVRFHTPYSDAAGVEIGEGMHKLIFDAAGELHFENVSVMMAADGFHVSFELRRLAGEAVEKAPDSFFDITIESVWVRTPTGTGTPAILSSTEFWAYPSVTGGRSELRMSRAADRGAKVVLYDVAGRRVRELEIQAGAEMTVWDGRDGAGAPVAAGVYMARVVEQGEARTARIVMVR